MRRPRRRQASRIAERGWPRLVAVELGLDESERPEDLRPRLARVAGVAKEDLPRVVLRKRSLDCRRGRVRCRLEFEIGGGEGLPLGDPPPREVKPGPPVLIVGDGPAGMFCAYQLARQGIGCTIVERGKPVQPRRKDLKGLNQRGEIDPDSNYCFGEGGAGTYSDGKLYTRSHKHGEVRDVMEILTICGAPPEILTDARPHIGSNLLPKVVSALRQKLEDVGVKFLFGARLVDVLTGPAEPVRLNGIRLADGRELEAAELVLATGHSARDVFELLERHGVAMEAKPFAIGCRIEHPQPLINQIQYGLSAGHAKLPSAAYRIADSSGAAAVYSFCMCPGGFIVPASTAPGELVVNGMSLSGRNSRYANSGMVMGLSLAALDEAGFGGTMGGVRFQRVLEGQCFRAAGELLAAPATRVTDFLERRASSSLPDTSYIPGLVASDLSEVLDSAGIGVSSAVRESLRTFGQRLPGYLTEEAALIGVESRTSSPVRVLRDDTLQSPSLRGLSPCGEGAGYAGGIMSAAVDGIRVARQVASRLS